MGRGLLVGIPGFSGGCDEAAVDFDGAFHASEEGGWFGVGGEEAGDGAASLGDKDFLAAALDFIEEVEAAGLEVPGCDLARHGGYGQVTMVRSRTCEERSHPLEHGVHAPSGPNFGSQRIHSQSTST